MATELTNGFLFNAHLEPLSSSTPASAGPYSRRLHPVLCSRVLNDQQSHRQKLVKEIFDTEHTYISQLNTIVALFLKPIRLGCLLPADVSMAIFSNVEGILSVNIELFSSMRQKSLGEAFNYLGPFLKLYSTYANNFQAASETLQEWRKHSPDFAHFIASQEARPECCGLTLPALLITPIQRIPRYKLLLEDLLKHTKTTHPDYPKLSAAAAQIAAVAAHINEHIRQHDNFKKMLSIQQSLSGPCVPGILAPGRLFLQEGKLMKVCRKKSKERVVFLFSDILIYGRPNLLERMEASRTYECRCVLPLLNSSISLVWEDPRVPGVSPLFKVSNVDTSLLFFSHQSEEVYQWAQVIEDAIHKLQLAFGSLMSSRRSGSLEELARRDVVRNPLLQGRARNPAGYNQPPPSPYPMMTTLISSHSLEDLSSRDKRDYGPSEQPSSTIASSNHGSEAPLLDSRGSDRMPEYDMKSVRSRRPRSSVTSSSGHQQLAAATQRPHSAHAGLGGAMGAEPRRRRKHKSRLKGDSEGIVLRNEFVEDEEEVIEVPDETGISHSRPGNGHPLQSLSAGSFGSYGAGGGVCRSQCCCIV